jgi:hypothetical protein
VFFAVVVLRQRIIGPGGQVLLPGTFSMVTFGSTRLVDFAAEMARVRLSHRRGL